MYILYMTLGEIVIDRLFINFRYMLTIEDRENFLNESVKKMYAKHLTKIRMSGDEPVFFARADSRMNKMHGIKIIKNKV